MGGMAQQPENPHRLLADAVVMGSAVVPWLARRPMVALLVALAVPTVIALVLAAALNNDSAPAEPETPAQEGVAEATLPEPTQFPPQSRVAATHRALHALGRACKQPLAIREPASVRRPVVVMEKFARDYPDGGFTMDDEPGSTLSLLIVLRYELQDCAPSLVPGVEGLIPRQFREPRSG